MFQSVTPAPPDPILGLTEAFKADPNPDKINLGVGVYKDSSGRTPVLDCVKAAERHIYDTESDKAYKPITGDPAYGRAVRDMMLGADHPVLEAGRAVTAHTPGGTGALRVVGDYLHQNHPTATLWLSDPTWANHPKVFESAGVPMKTYRYFDAATNALDFDAMVASLSEAPAGDVVLLHGCCHNPTGVDPTVQQWQRIGDLLAERSLVPLVDFAYQGFGDGLDEDAAGLRALADRVDELFVCTSYSKNFSLYCERVGSLTAIAADPDTAKAVDSRIKIAIRTNYSNPPAHGAAIVSTILADPALTRQWQGELTAMRRRINGMRRLFVAKLAEHGATGDYGFITAQRGMFSFSGLSRDQVDRLRDEHSIYIVGSGRINVAGITESNVDRLCAAIAGVL